VAGVSRQGLCVISLSHPQAQARSLYFFLFLCSINKHYAANTHTLFMHYAHIKNIKSTDKRQAVIHLVSYAEPNVCAHSLLVFNRVCGWDSVRMALHFSSLNLTHIIWGSRGQKREALIKEPVLCFMNYEIHLRPKGEKELHYSKYLSVLWVDSSGRVREAGWRDESEDKRERGSEKETALITVSLSWPRRQRCWQLPQTNLPLLSE